MNLSRIINSLEGPGTWRLPCTFYRQVIIEESGIKFVDQESYLALAVLDK